MNIVITPETTVGSLRAQFHLEFPRLSLRLFESSHEKGKWSPASQMIDDNESLSRWVKSPLSLFIDPEMTVEQVESIFEKSGMHVQVFRQSGKLWLETTRTDDWALNRINSEEY